MRILIVAPNISLRMGGEAALPFHYVRELRKLGIQVDALTHARVREELIGSGLAGGGLHFVEDVRLERALFALARRAPKAISDPVFGSGVAATTLYRLARRTRALCREKPFDLVHQPTPVSPLFPSFLTGLSVPVVIGPLNGAMDYPAGFAREYAQGEFAVRAARVLARIVNIAIAGKRRAARILVANERTRAALPKGIDPGRVEVFLDNGVDLDLWSPPAAERFAPSTFVFVGRLVRLKGVDLLIEAFASLEAPARLIIVGDGEERVRLEALAAQRSAAMRPIEFLGFRPQAEIRDLLVRATALVLPSLRECGGAVILEAFACGTPAIATEWGGPKDYVTKDTGFLVAPENPGLFAKGLARAMSTLAGDRALVKRMGAAARARVEARFSWAAKARAMASTYLDVIAEASP